jgi:hypothetical protein
MPTTFVRRLISPFGRSHPAQHLLEAARQQADRRDRSEAMTVFAQRLPIAERASVFAEVLESARHIGDVFDRKSAIVALEAWLSAERSLSVARNIKNETLRAKALSAAAKWLPLELAQAAISEINDSEIRAESIIAITQRRSVNKQLCEIEEGLNAAHRIDEAGARTLLLHETSRQFSTTQASETVFHHWISTVHVSATRSRKDCVGDMIATLPFIASFGGAAAITGFRDSLLLVGLWWP